MERDNKVGFSATWHCEHRSGRLSLFSKWLSASNSCGVKGGTTVASCIQPLENNFCPHLSDKMSLSRAAPSIVDWQKTAVMTLAVVVLGEVSAAMPTPLSRAQRNKTFDIEPMQENGNLSKKRP